MLYFDFIRILNLCFFHIWTLKFYQFKFWRIFSTAKQKLTNLNFFSHDIQICELKFVTSLYTDIHVRVC